LKYLLLLYDDAATIAAMTADARRAMVDDHVGYATMLRERGVHRAGEPLDAPQTARTLRFGASGKEDPVVTDGPFLEAKEALGGFYLLECTSDEEALELAKRVPRSPGLVAELRPIAEI
jgi:hypothetical protein